MFVLRVTCIFRQSHFIRLYRKYLIGAHVASTPIKKFEKAISILKTILQRTMVIIVRFFRIRFRRSKN